MSYHYFWGKPLNHTMITKKHEEVMEEYRKMMDEPMKNKKPDNVTINININVIPDTDVSSVAEQVKEAVTQYINI